MHEAAAIVDGLMVVRNEIEDGDFPWRAELEDIHMNIERRLFETIGETAGKLHTARSRNDQVAVDVRLYVKEAIGDVLDAIHGLRVALVGLAEANADAVMPGYTHLQRAQPVLFAHHMLAYFEMLCRDAERFRQARARADVLPLGSGALAGVPYPVDRDFVARELGFAAVSANSMDAVSDRDFLLDFHSASAICAVHLSRMAEELVVWSSDEFGFVRLGDDYTTGSSIMPQKRNPDFAELARGKTGRVFGNLVATLTVLKGLPLTYNRDLQEDKEALFDTVDTIVPTLRAMAGMLSTMEVRRDNLRAAAQSGYLLATDVADYLAVRGSAVPRGARRRRPHLGSGVPGGQGAGRAAAGDVQGVLAAVPERRAVDHGRLVRRREGGARRHGAGERPAVPVAGAGRPGGGRWPVAASRSRRRSCRPTSAAWGSRLRRPPRAGPTTSTST